MSVLYLTYDGILEPLGQSQVLRYLERLAPEHKIVLISFEKLDDWQQIERREALRSHIRAAGITWVPLRYHKRPSALATAYDIAQGVIVGAWAVMRHRIRIVHARSYVPSVIALALKKLFRLKYIFDMRGFWADEKVDGGAWQPGSRLFRLAKWFERHFLTNADVVVSLTHAGVAAMRDFPYLINNLPLFEVIPTCTDLERFRPIGSKFPKQRTSRQRFTLCYLGSVGTRYLFDSVLDYFKILRTLCSDARLLVINRGDHDYIRERMRILDIRESWVEIKSVEYSNVAKELGQVDAGIFFYKPAFSTMGTAPTKLGEFLACGVPCLANGGVGDYEKILEEEGVGVVLHAFGAQEQEKAVRQLLNLAADPRVGERCIAAARHHFSLEQGVERYDRIYRSLTRPSSGRNERWI